MRLNGFQRILIITAAVLAAVVSSLLIRHYDNNIWEYSLRNWCDDDLPLPRLINDVADESQPEKELVLSADRRVNPRSLYVKVNNRIFAIDISAKGEKGND